MANMSVDYTFTNATTADASQINTNFTNVINATLDVTKDFSISALTVGGTLTANGNVNLGNASSDDLSITASLASSLAIKTTASYNIGSSTLGLLSMYLGNSTFTTRLLSGASASWSFTFPTTAGTSDYVLKTDGAGVTSWRAWTTPTVQKFTSGTGTYTTPANVKWIRVRMVGGGGGGGGSGTSSSSSDGGAGGGSYFRVGASPDLLVANGGSGGAFSSTTAAGGTASLGTGPVGLAFSGAAGGGGKYETSASAYPEGGHGGSSPFGGAGIGARSVNGAAAAANSGSGGASGGAGANTANTYIACGGGAGGYVDAIITAPSASYAYAVGAAGSAGGAGFGSATTTGGVGGAGIIIIEEFYQ